MADDQNKNEEEMPHFMQRQYGKSASTLEASHEELSDVRKQMIRFALEFPIRDIRTYSGYKGDLLVEITTGNDDILSELKAHAESLGMEVVVKERYDTRIHEVYCIVPDENIYRLK
ncbi:hypothetical protein LOH54_00585 [Sulfurimonas sp. HSL-3221]|uniref:hypothetical protein n=1 Tax=Sulfurimonadaceae TaxID=2771471 RepID=UPI001E507394|nr:hypothetical protein [Sulfurimonas sp. HSL-3221]UFS62644.1 hypothetical protein LOH54_00585 [Sulfurimonas sp. HSL-3221]